MSVKELIGVLWKFPGDLPVRTKGKGLYSIGLYEGFVKSFLLGKYIDIN